MKKKEAERRRDSSERSCVRSGGGRRKFFNLCFSSASVDPVCRIAMTATVLSDTKLITHMEAEFVQCYCCELTEECTPAYIELIRERHNGNWICGLCSEAISYEILRSDGVITAEEAMESHMKLCKMLTKPPPNPTVHLITAVRQILKRSLDSPSRPSTPTRQNSRQPPPPPPLGRSGSFVSSLSGS